MGKYASITRSASSIAPDHKFGEREKRTQAYHGGIYSRLAQLGRKRTTIGTEAFTLHDFTPPSDGGDFANVSESATLRRSAEHHPRLVFCYFFLPEYNGKFIFDECLSSLAHPRGSGRGHRSHDSVFKFDGLFFYKYLYI